MKPRLFIGASQEADSIAKQIQLFLSNSIEANTWDMDTFRLGENGLDSLYREVILSDFALLVMSPDDKVVKRRKTSGAARDNVLFELGLFMGALGPRKCFYLVAVDKKKGKIGQVEIPSDLAGINRLQVEIDSEDFLSQLRSQCTKIEQTIERNKAEHGLNLLPSTTLALGYFNNFVIQVCQVLVNRKNIRINGQRIDLKRQNFDFNIILPDSVNDASHPGYRKFTMSRNLTEVQMKGFHASRKFPFFVDAELREGRLQIYDYPTTLGTIRTYIDFTSRIGGNKMSKEDKDRLESREIRNFITVLKRLEEMPDAAGFRDNIHIKSVSELT